MHHRALPGVCFHGNPVLSTGLELLPGTLFFFANIYNKPPEPMPINQGLKQAKKKKILYLLQFSGF